MKVCGFVNKFENWVAGYLIKSLIARTAGIAGAVMSSGDIEPVKNGRAGSGIGKIGADDAGTSLTIPF